MQNVLSERLLEFAGEIIKIIGLLRRTFVGRQIAGQLLRSSTSAGANYEEHAELKAGWILSISCKSF
ncbi:MAG: hypothetical protein H6Q42_3640 [Deltaproteobacteria bacterium]|nr:hypothetical protein [Deltaproteobacteria bacterium]